MKMHAKNKIPAWIILVSVWILLSCEKTTTIIPTTITKIMPLPSPLPIVEASYTTDTIGRAIMRRPLWQKAAFVTVATGCCVGYSCLKVLTTGNECLIERYGKYHRKLTAGWHLILPIVERISYEATTREQVLDIPPQKCFTLDNAPLMVDAVVYMKIFSLEAAKYNIENIHSAILNLCTTQVREEIGKLQLDETFSSRDRVNQNLLKVMNDVCRSWGVEITRVDIQKLDPSQTILSAMELQMAAEREKRAKILQSEGERSTLVNQAEGRAKATIADAEAKRKSIVLLAQAEVERMKLEAEGIQEAIERIVRSISSSSSSSASGTTSSATATSRGRGGPQPPLSPPPPPPPAGKDAIDAALQLLMMTRYLETQAKFASSNGTKVLMFPTKDSVPLTYEGLTSLLR